MTPLQRYIEAWTANDPDAIASAVADECVITECYGPVYRGRDRVHQWARAWLDAGGRVHSWTITDSFTSDDHEAAQWIFECTWKGSRDTFEGCTIATATSGLICSLREYQTTAPLYDWAGTWQ